MPNNNNLIPANSHVFACLRKAVQTGTVVAFSGLPGVGKSLYINQFKHIADAQGRRVTVIQWDIARKAFEIPEIAARYPMGEGIVHNGLKVSAGKWLMATLKTWLINHDPNHDLLLIEAPLVGHRFIELVKAHDDDDLNSFLKSDDFQVLVPIPSKTVRTKIEADRRAQVAEDAVSWTGAKPSVMLMLWKLICGIANEFGQNISMEGQPAYDPKIYEFVFSKILKHRHFVPLHIDEVFEVDWADETELHQINSLAADEQTALHYFNQTRSEYPNDEALDAFVKQWYVT